MRASLLPWRARVFLLILSSCAALPIAVALAALVRSARDVTSPSALCLLAGAILVLAALIAFEKPRSAAYLQKLQGSVCPDPGRCLHRLLEGREPSVAVTVPVAFAYSWYL